MYILGINPGIFRYNHDSSACLIKDGKLIAFASQDRFDRIKHSHHYPKDAINWCLKYAGINEGDVDYITTSMDPKGYFGSTLSYINKTFNLHNAFNRGINAFLFLTCGRAMNLLKNQFKNKKLIPIPHHLAHAASCFYVSGFKKANILTMDARGEDESTVFFLGEDNKIDKIWNNSVFNNHSFGLCYTLMTDILGLGRFGEGKTMGLAPYGKPNIDFSRILRYRINHKHCLADYSQILKFSKFRRKRGEELKKIHKNLAASLQTSLENTILGLVEEIYDTTGIKKLCLAGGTFLNCKTNGLIVETGMFDDIFIQPAASDDGTSLGAAMQVYTQLGYKPKTILEHAYWGPEFTNEEIEKTLKDNDEKYEYHDDIAGVVAELLIKNKIVGWFQGKLEMGPRALGNRTILANPTVPEMADKTNEVKGREKWRPLAPSLLEEAMGEYFYTDWPSPFMILSFDVKEEKIKEIPAIVHVDGSARPQTVSKKTNPRYYDLIKKFEELSSVPIVLNTSFNRRGEPIVCTPEGALKAFKGSKMDCVAIGNFLLTK